MMILYKPLIYEGFEDHGTSLLSILAVEDKSHEVIRSPSIEASKDTSQVSHSQLPTRSYAAIFTIFPCKIDTQISVLLGKQVSRKVGTFN